MSVSENGIVDASDCVGRALAQLRPEDQELLRLSEWEELKPPEIAVIFECSANAASIRLHRARRRFGRALEDVEAEVLERAEREASS